MKAPSRPANEAQRFDALRSYELLDTSPEPEFDALTRLAALMLDVPIVLVSLVDEDRQWFKSRFGLDATETSRDISFCGHVVAEAAALIVPDTLLDPRFVDNPLVTGDPRIRFYAGMPLRTEGGLVLGTLCAIDSAPRELTKKQGQTLALLAGMVVERFETRRALAIRQRVVDAVPGALAYWSSDERCLFANATYRGWFGVSAADLVGKTMKELLGPMYSINRPYVEGALRGEEQDFEREFPDPAGGPPRQCQVHYVSDTSGGHVRGFSVLVTDVTATKITMSRLARQERLITTGTLAAGVGHEINNPLTYVHANIDFAIEELRTIGGGSPSARLRELVTVLGEARDGADRIRKIVLGLRALAREESEPTATALEGAVEIAINVAAHELRPKATVITKLAQTPLVLADESRLSQILVNLIVNAAQAFATGNVEANHIIVASRLEPDGRVSVAVSDNGPGIAEDVRRRIFDPFFTTKAIGQGTGLGLSICQNVVSSLDGEIVVESVVGEGTTFRVFLKAAPELAPESAQRLPLDVATADRGKVLVLDDEPVIVSTLRRILGRDHAVTGLTDVREAMKLIEGGETYDVVLCDLAMPHVSGADFYEWVRGINPALAERFVFITGAVAEPTSQRFLAEVPNERVEKPFSVQNLRGIARRFAGQRRPIMPTGR